MNEHQAAESEVWGLWHGPLHGEPGQSNSFHRWWPSDSLENYDAKGNLYKPTDFGYRFNANGFRCDEIDPDGDYDLRLLFVGCSHTFGVGLPMEHVYAHRLTMMWREAGLKVPYWNLALGGRSTDYCARMLYKAVPLLKPDFVIAYLPGLHRRELFATKVNDGNVEGLVDYVFADHSGFTDSATRRAFTRLFTHANDLLNAARNFALIETTLALHKVDYMWNSWFFRDDNYSSINAILTPDLANRRFACNVYDPLDGGQFPDPPLARDKLHVGPDNHLLFAKRLYKNMEERVEAILAQK